MKAGKSKKSPNEQRVLRLIGPESLTGKKARVSQT